MEPYINRFFDKTGADSGTQVLSPDQVVARINSAEGKVNKLCLVKGNTGAPQEAALALSFLKKEINTILHGAVKPENAPQHQDTLTSVI